MIVLCTVFAMGGFTKPVLNLCGVEMSGAKASTTAADNRDSIAPGGVPMPPGRIGLKAMTSKRLWKRGLIWVDRSVLRPVLIADYEHLPPATTATAAAARSRSTVAARRAECVPGAAGAPGEAALPQSEPDGSRADAPLHQERL